ncbi:peptidoglycan-binding domain-containing protein [Rivularia sp. UHCC 0363]|uniref:peptidoglycan-binding domain-containing protein n=1 Tax=Rivularia sp. UHCC 0363 TaxID=3110244 RepID=UPI002B1FEDE0|nr:peptidoglycan-binding domain-containing protein [Rivularia sp. UHCC 0363]MEA5599095.1 peptidoglycan-binding domain-containing protein [Rivularia sp. UHCC 0363]
MMTLTTTQRSISEVTTMLAKTTLSIIVTTGVVGVFQMHPVIATSPPQQSPILVATAYTDLTLPTLRRGDRGRSVQMLQQILLDNGFLGAAGVRLGNPNGAAVDGVFGAITESAVRDLQQRYNIPVTGQVNPVAWEMLDMQENPYRSPLPWKF